MEYLADFLALVAGFFAGRVSAGGESRAGALRAAAGLGFVVALVALIALAAWLWMSGRGGGWVAGGAAVALAIGGAAGLVVSAGSWADRALAGRLGGVKVGIPLAVVLVVAVFASGVLSGNKGEGRGNEGQATAASSGGEEKARAVAGLPVAGGDGKAVGGASPAASVAGGGNVEGASGAASCECNNGAWCQGPQGGTYCITPEGKKRYKKV